MPHFPPKLLAGYRSFRQNRFRNEHTRYRQLAADGQQPEVMMIACCDSRAAPEIIFDTRPGEIFVVRNVANQVPPFQPDGEYHGTSAALEYGVATLGIRHIVVLGHGRCGGINVALTRYQEQKNPANLPARGDFLGRWMGLLEPATKAVCADSSLTFEERQSTLERVALRYSLHNLRSFPWIVTRESAGQLQLHAAWFDIASGELLILDEASGEFLPAN